MKVQLNAKQKTIHERAIYLARRSENMEFARVENLIDVESSEVHKAFGKKMYVYATEVLNMDREKAYPYIKIARCCVKYPSLRSSLREKTLTVSKVARIVSVLNSENAEEWIEFAKTHSKRQIEEEVVREHPKTGVRDRLRPLSAEYDELKVKLEKNVSQKIKRAQALNPSLDLAGVIDKAFEFYLHHKDPVRKASRAPSPKTPKKYARAHKRVPLSAAEEHAVNQKDQGRCTFIEADGKRCDCERWTQIHHIIPVSLGGTNDPENLTTLCSFHHDLVHQLTLPIDGQVAWFR